MSKEHEESVKDEVAREVQAVSGFAFDTSVQWGSDTPGMETETTTEEFVLRDSDFAYSHRGVRYNLKCSAVDIMDCLTFVSATQNSAFSMKRKFFKNVPTWDTVWNTSCPRRKRAVCTFTTMLQILSLCKKPESKLLSRKISAVYSSSLGKGDVTECSLDFKTIGDDVDTPDAKRRKENYTLERIERMMTFLKAQGGCDNEYSILLKKYMEFV
jgi:hypothetical protein